MKKRSPKGRRQACLPKTRQENPFAWLQQFSASDGLRFFWNSAHALFSAQPLDPDVAAAELIWRLDPLVRKLMESEGSIPGFTCWARLAVAFWDQLITHRLTSVEANRIRSVRLASFPDQAPYFLKRPWLIEVAEPLRGQRLFGDTTALGCYFDERSGLAMLIGWMFVNGQPRLRGMYWNQSYTAPGLPDLDRSDQDYEWQDGAWVPVSTMPDGTFNARRDWFVDGIQFATLFGALLEAENSCLRVHETVPSTRHEKPPGQGVSNPPPWIIRHVAIDPVEELWPPTPKSQQSLPPDAPVNPQNHEGLLLVNVRVREYVRLQRCGDGHRERRWVRIKAHVSHRWTSPTPKRVIVHAKK